MANKKYKHPERFDFDLNTRSGVIIALNAIGACSFGTQKATRLGRNGAEIYNRYNNTENLLWFYNRMLDAGVLSLETYRKLRTIYFEWGPERIRADKMRQIVPFSRVRRALPALARYEKARLKTYLAFAVNPAII